MKPDPRPIDLAAIRARDAFYEDDGLCKTYEHILLARKANDVQQCPKDRRDLLALVDQLGAALGDLLGDLNLRAELRAQLEGGEIVVDVSDSILYRARTALALLTGETP